MRCVGCVTCNSHCGAVVLVDLSTRWIPPARHALSLVTSTCLIPRAYITHLAATLAPSTAMSATAEVSMRQLRHKKRRHSKLSASSRPLTAIVPSVQPLSQRSASLLLVTDTLLPPGTLPPSAEVLPSEPLSSPPCNSSSTFQLLSQLPTPLLALVASHLQPDALLRLQRCSLAHRRLREDDAYMSVAWRNAILRLSQLEPLHHWALPCEQCIELNGRCLVPLSAWQTAVPVLRRALRVMQARKNYTPRVEWLRRQVEHSQSIEWIAATQRWADDVWQAVSDKNVVAGDAQQRADVRRVAVLRYFDYAQFDADANSHYGQGLEVEVRCQLLLQACPYLQHLHLAINAPHAEQPRHEDSLALVPRLLSLSLESFHIKSPLEWRTLLDSVPSLTSLTWTYVDSIDIDRLLDIASHSTLEQLHIDTNRWSQGHNVWLGDRMLFPIAVDDDERQFNAYFDRHMWKGVLPAQTEADDAVFFRQLATYYLVDSSEQESSEQQSARVIAHQLRTALTRTQPTQRSCEVRLALADWLSRRLRRDRLFTDDGRLTSRHSVSQLLQYRMLLVLVRSTLRQQLIEVAETEAARSLLVTQ